MAYQPVFRATVIDPDTMQAALDDERPKGEVEVLAAVFDIPDTYVAVGEKERKVIDRGAFAAFIGSARSRPVPWYYKHGDAHLTGFVDPALKLGRADEFTESSEGLVVRGSYNLQKQIAREAYSDLIHDPAGAQFSFRNDLSTEVTRQGNDGLTHITDLGTMAVEEVSQVGVAAQQEARLLALRGAMEWGWTPQEVRALLADPRFRAAIEAVGGAVTVETPQPQPEPAPDEPEEPEDEAEILDAVVEFYKARFGRSPS